MKTQLIYCLVAISSFFAFSCKSDDGISYEQKKVDTTVLSSNSSNFIKTHFPKILINGVVQFEPQKPNGAIYEVEVGKDFLIEFDEVGNWISIEKIGSIEFPNQLVHQSIINYIQKVYEEDKIEKIERIKEGYNVELSHDIDLEFDKNGEFVQRLP